MHGGGAPAAGRGGSTGSGTGTAALPDPSGPRPHQPRKPALPDPSGIDPALPPDDAGPRPHQPRKPAPAPGTPQGKAPPGPAAPATPGAQGTRPATSATRTPGSHPGTGEHAPRNPRDTARPTPSTPRPLPPSRPTRLLIPYLRLDAPVIPLGLDREHRLTAPPEDDPKLVGWYRQGASPGEQGTAVAVGHLDTHSGPAVFAGLTELKRGRIVKARRADGRTAVYTVDKVKAYQKADFPGREVYGARGRPELRLITCGGSYDRRKGYSGNVVVFAHLTGVV
ncbi:class F sortase [Streptomyces sp. NPDC058735]|uniref:class F sortase n=1 Tax=unclassified Streptomyces TaxID=2593676 RepID=UPI00369E8847